MAIEHLFSLGVVECSLSIAQEWSVSLNSGTKIPAFGLG